MTDIVILSATRTPIGAFQGAFAGVPAPKLGAAAIRGAIAQAGVNPADVTDCLMGNVLQAGQGMGQRRAIELGAGRLHTQRLAHIVRHARLPLGPHEAPWRQLVLLVGRLASPHPQGHGMLARGVDD